MLVRLLLVVAALIGAYFLIRRLRRFSWGAQGPRLAIAAGITALLLLLTVRGGAEIAVPLLTVLAPFLLRWLNAPRPLPSPVAPAPAGSSGCSTVTTRFLSMELDHATGAMSGRVLEGRFARCSLRDLSLQDLLELWRECQSDPQSVAVLEAYLDRHAEVDWRERLRDADRAADPNRVSGTMDRAEAYQILGLQPGASREDIQSAYRRLIQRVHPDHGGSSYLAARLNQARDVLLGMGSS
jgi:hypothetical protein